MTEDIKRATDPKEIASMSAFGIDIDEFEAETLSNAYLDLREAAEKVVEAEGEGFDALARAMHLLRRALKEKE